MTSSTPPRAAGPATLLAFDTSTETLAVALCWPGGTLTRLAAGGAAASATLLPEVQALLQQAGLALQAVDGIAFGRGPGAFTGLRTSCAVAQGLALGLGCPVLPLDSLLIVAEDARAQLALQHDDAPIDVAVAMDARMDEVYAARFRWHAATGWAVVQAPALYTLPALAAAWAAVRPTAWTGSALGAFGARLGFGVAAPSDGAVPRWLATEQDRAAALLRLAAAGWAAGAAVDAAQALPLYLRDKIALTTVEREQARDRRDQAAPGMAPAAAPR